eukprot:TRINITY_DN4755_c0_g1_i4.p1 TRINITY_DN4755_c0_g1~~TRINITY_DN4755_c0_g1_i4.p1  ORF type:complete len:151 (+),score=24.80 TRINITY_DN4755_c0_g1_i4:481-933(+)
MTPDPAGLVPIANWFARFEVAEASLKHEIKQWLHSLFVSHLGSVGNSFRAMENPKGIVTVLEFSNTLEKMLGMQLAKYDLARILWSLDAADISDKGEMATQDWIECFDGIESTEHMHGEHSDVSNPFQHQTPGPSEDAATSSPQHEEDAP